MKDELRSEFVSEIGEIIDETVNLVLTIENETIDTQSPKVQQIMRNLHSAKGGCSMFDYPRLSEGFHAMEDMFLQWSNQGAVPAGGVDYLLKFFDVAKNTLHSEDEFFTHPTLRTTSNHEMRHESHRGQSHLAQKEIKLSEKTSEIVSRSRLQDEIKFHYSDYNSELLAYVIDQDKNNILEILKRLRGDGFLTKSFSSVTKAMLTIKQDHPDVIIINSNTYDYGQYNLVKDLAQSKIPIPIIIIDGPFNKERLKEWLRIGIKTVIADIQDLDLISFKSRWHARSYRSQKILLEALALATYQLGVINYPGQNLLPEKKVVDIQNQVKALIKAKKSFTDFG